MRSLHLAPLAALALLAVPAAAEAGTVTYSSGNVLLYTASPGEANRLQVSATAELVTYRELGGIPIAEAQADCTGNGTPQVSCKVDHSPGHPVYSASADLGDLDDEATAAAGMPLSITANFRGEAGDDVLDASAALDSDLYGGPGDDVLSAARVDAFLQDGTGHDVLIGGPSGSTVEYWMSDTADGPDVIQGGAGLDRVGYDARIAAVRVSADGVADDGEAGEGDNVSPAVEDLSGGEGDDVLTATASASARMWGGAGNDRLEGGGGDDRFYADAGADVYVGGAGDDRLAPRNETVPLPGGDGADSFAGGPGVDRIDYGSRVEAVSVSLDGAPGDGEAGEGDNVGTDVEDVTAGFGNDLLTGNDAAQRLSGGPGADTIDARGGSDAVRGGDGDDTIAATDGALDTVACGFGSDTAGGDWTDLFEDCETASRGAAPPAADTAKPVVSLRGVPAKVRMKRLRRGLRIRLSADEPVAYAVELQATVKRATAAAFNLRLARRSLPRSAAAQQVTLKPKVALGGRKPVRVRVRVTATDAAGNRTVITKRVRVSRG